MVEAGAFAQFQQVVRPGALDHGAGTDRASGGDHEGKKGSKGFWTRIGAAWPHQNGDGFNIQLDCVPVDGRIVLRPAKAEDEEAGA